MGTIDYTPFDTLRPHFDALARVGYFKILKTLSPTKLILHYAFRLFIWTVVAAYNLQHIIRVALSKNTDEVVDTMFILLTIINTLAKQITFNLRNSRIEDIVGLINGVLVLPIAGPGFALSTPYHETVMRSNGFVMSFLLKFYHSAVFFCGVLWTLFPILNRFRGEDDNFTGYIPFDTRNVVAFGMAVAYMNIFIVVQAYGNVTMDCTIVAFYAQASTQIQILRHNMEQITNLEDKNIDRNQLCIDEGQEIIQQRFVRCIEHHKRILWFVKEIQSIFSEAMVLQFLVMAWVICMTVYKIANLNILSAEFVSMAVYLICMMAQLFIYCYFGSQLTVESEFLNRSLYSMDWLSLSPRFRRQLLVIMQYCSSPITLRTAYIIPMSLDTYIKVLKSSYTLFTFLNR